MQSFVVSLSNHSVINLVLTLWYNTSGLTRGGILKALEIARKAVEAAGEKQASNVALLDIRELSSFADYFVICSGSSDKQLRAIFEEVEHQLKAQGEVPNHSEGSPGSGWILLDYGDVIVHIFSAEEREYFQLDELWSKARQVLRIQ
jgi:ribosome-associated protein